MAHSIVEAQQPQTDDRRTRDEKGCEVDGIECPNRVAGERLACAINHLGRYSQDLPMSSSRDEVRSTVGGLGLRELLERYRPQQYAVTFDQRQV